MIDPQTFAGGSVCCFVHGESECAVNHNVFLRFLGHVCEVLEGYVGVLGVRFLEDMFEYVWQVFGRYLEVCLGGC